MDESGAEPACTDPEIEAALELDEELVKEHPRHRQLIAAAIAVFFLAMTILAAGYSLLQDQPTPARTRPLPPVIPAQGAIR